ncbi:hypothetical protein [Sphingomonas sp. BAUL-RG-20F-R05-02]|uniref:hypothetical protein n=1 Tax=Sphingomonas sp. BAUL-RG-20F-R05-02 TaxID=2914830 RepID=UPI001F58DE18|nr:hypothetical protein [Sphingomonas sp. BAUL-RG-20F-R05-02]
MTVAPGGSIWFTDLIFKHRYAVLAEPELDPRSVYHLNPTIAELTRITDFG